MAGREIRLKRAYEEPSPSDGYRVLVDGIWPRGVKKEQLQLDKWLKGLAPSTPLRKWFHHDPKKWESFKQRYYKELDGKTDELQELEKMVQSGPVTLVFGAKDEEYNNAVALKSYLKEWVLH